jgi:hypothetical protein
VAEAPLELFKGGGAAYNSWGGASPNLISADQSMTFPRLGRSDAAPSSKIINFHNTGYKTRRHT